MQPTKTFNLSKTTKRIMCSMVDAEARNAFKQAMIQAQLQSAFVPKKDKSDTK